MNITYSGGSIPPARTHIHSSASIMDLPGGGYIPMEIVQEITKCLQDDRDIRSAACVSQSWRRGSLQGPHGKVVINCSHDVICRDEGTWENLDVPTPSRSRIVREFITASASTLREVEFTGIEGDEIIHDLPGIISTIASHVERLTLEFSEKVWNSRWHGRIVFPPTVRELLPSASFQNLSHLTIMSCTVEQPGANFSLPVLSELHLFGVGDPEWVTSFVENACPALRRLVVTYKDRSLILRSQSMIEAQVTHPDDGGGSQTQEESLLHLVAASLISLEVVGVASMVLEDTVCLREMAVSSINLRDVQWRNPKQRPPRGCNIRMLPV